MEIRENTRVARWFFWSLEIWLTFIGNHHQYVEKYDNTYKTLVRTCENRISVIRENGTNLCHMARVMFLYAPLVLLLHFAMYSVSASALFVAPIYFFGFRSYASGVLQLGALVLGFGILFLAIPGFLIWSYGLIKERIRNRKKTGEIGSTWQLIGEWLLAKKQKICPLITFIRTDNPEASQ